MRRNVVLKATDLVSGEVRILAEGPCIVKDDTLLYREKETGARHRIEFKEDLIIERRADVHSTTVLKEGSSGEAVVESPYGMMSLRTECLHKSRDENRWMAEYAVYSGEEQILHQKLEWILKDPSRQA